MVAKGGPHLTPTKDDHFPGYRINVSPGHMSGANWLPAFATVLYAWHCKHHVAHITRLREQKGW